MSGLLEQTKDELDFLVGATITKVRVKRDNSLYGMGDVIELSATLNDAITDQYGTTSHQVKIEVWQDPEGNGPGFLALSEVVKPKAAKS